MPTYKCVNKACSYFGALSTVNNVSLRYDKNEGRVIDSGCRCPNCGAIREDVREPGMTTTMLGSPNICKK